MRLSLVRHSRVLMLDEATARKDPETDAHTNSKHAIPTHDTHLKHTTSPRAQLYNPLLRLPKNGDNEPKKQHKRGER